MWSSLSFLMAACLGLEMSRAVITCTWDDVPHLSEDAKADMLKSYPPYQRDARSKGIPQLGSGAIYQVPESEITIADFAIPAHWPRVYGLDVGWRFTAAPFLAIDRESQTTYIYSVYKRGLVEPSVHAQAIQARGKWIPGVVDPASRGRSQADGNKLIETYTELGLNLTPANNAVEAGIYIVWELLSQGRLKVFASCGQWFEEYRLYRRNEKGQIVKDQTGPGEHLLDATRYAVVSGRDLAIVKPKEAGEDADRYIGEHAWMG
jgi:hypothetical protein